MIRFESPLAFLLLLVLPLVVWLHFRQRGRRATLRFSSITTALRSGKSLRQVFIGLPRALRLLALTLIVVALARPQMGKERIRDVSKGIAIEMVVDRSGSMAAEMEYQGRRATRLEVVKEVFQQFVHGDRKGKSGLKGRPNDLIGMVAFARYADTICPLTLGHGALTHFLESVRIVRRRSEDGTAIGDAMALAAARLKTAEETLKRQTGEREDAYQIKSKVMIVLTDGVNNCGERTPEEAAELAREWGIKIYTIGVGGNEAVAAVNSIFGTFLRANMGGGVDETTLRRVAQITGGRFFLAESAEGLQKVYAEIDRLERSEIETMRYLDYREVFVPFAGAALALLALEVALSCTLFRRIP